MGVLRAGITFVVGYFTIHFINTQKKIIKNIPVIGNYLIKKEKSKKGFFTPSPSESPSPSDTEYSNLINTELYILLICLVVKDLVL